MGWSGFVVRPFGVRKIVPASGEPYQVDYERVQRELIDPAMKAAGIAGATVLADGRVVLILDIAARIRCGLARRAPGGVRQQRRTLLHALPKVDEGGEAGERIELRMR
jgi:hypothetical protein